jgi:hypothetical protein
VTYAVRPAQPADFERWLPLWEGYNAFYQRMVPAEVTRTTWARFFDACEPMHALVAEDGGKLLGLVHYLFHRNTAMLRRPATCRTCTRWRRRAGRAWAAH